VSSPPNLTQLRSGIILDLEQGKPGSRFYSLGAPESRDFRHAGVFDFVCVFPTTISHSVAVQTVPG
jgi:hypothetical protein